MSYGPDGQLHYNDAGTGGAPAQPDMFNNPAPGQGADPNDDSYWKNSPFYQPGMNNSAPATPTTPAPGTTPPPAPIAGTGNPGNDRSRPPGPDAQNWFWSGTANHWVDSTGKRDATGRELSAGEQTAWQGYDTTRAQNTAAGMPTAFPTDAFIQNAAGLPAATATQAAVAGAGGPGGTAPAPTYPKYDPTLLSQVQSVLESPTGPYANRKPGDYGPIGAPDFVLNPTTPEQWNQRFYWFAEHPEAFTTGYTQPRDLTAEQYDYTKPNSVPYTVFLQNAYADTNARQGFTELNGVLTPQQLAAAQKEKGWGDAVAGINPDGNLVYKTMYKMAAADTASEYNVVKVLQPDGSIGYSLQKRLINRAAPVAPVVAASGGGGNNNRPNYPANRGGSQAPIAQKSAGWTHIQPGTAPDTRPVGGSVNLARPVEGQVVDFNGRIYQRRGGQWVPWHYEGSSQHPVPK